MENNLEYLVERKFLDSKEVSSLGSFFVSAYNDANHVGEPYANVIQFDRNAVVNSKVLGSIEKRIKAFFSDNLGVTGINLAKCWLVKSLPKDTDPTKLPYLPHFDKHRYLKAMIYLHDVVEDHGPIHFGKLHAPYKIDERRRGLPANYKELGLNTIKISELRTGMQPILGKKGDVIFFDTNAAHCAGIVSKGFERRVIRFDFDVSDFNPHQTFAKRLVSFFRQ